MAKKRVAKHTILEVDYSGAGTSYEAVTLVREVTPPPDVRMRVDGLALGDARSIPLMGVLEESDMTFQMFWDPGDTAHEKVRAAVLSEDVCKIKITFTNEASPYYMEFDGIFTNIEPQSQDSTGSIQQNVTVSVQSDAITIANT